MTDTAPAPTATLVSRAAQQLAALADRERAALLGSALRLEETTQGATVVALAADRATDLRTAARHLATLEAAGLVTVREHRVLPRVEALEATVEALLAALPISSLLTEDPALGRLFRHGRLTGLPVLARVEERERLADLLVRLVPEERALTEAEVDLALADVTDDVASVRRFLVEEGRLTRGAGRDYRRVST